MSVGEDDGFAGAEEEIDEDGRVAEAFLFEEFTVAVDVREDGGSVEGRLGEGR